MEEKVIGTKLMKLFSIVLLGCVMCCMSGCQGNKQENATSKYHFEQDVTSEQEMNEYIQKMQSFYDKVVDYVGQKPNEDFEVQVVKKMEQSRNYVENHTLYCICKELDKENYKQNFVKAMYGIENDWAAVGIAYNAENAVYEKNLAEYFEEKGTSKMTLFPGFYIKEINYKEDYYDSLAIASQLTNYMIQKKEKKHIFTDAISTEEKNEWLESVGSSVKCDETLEAAFQDATYGADGIGLFSMKNKYAYFSFCNNAYFKSANQMQKLVEEIYLCDLKLTEWQERYQKYFPTSKRTMVGFRMRPEEEDVSEWENEEDPECNVYFFRTSYPNIVKRYMMVNIGDMVKEEYQNDSYAWKMVAYRDYYSMFNQPEVQTDRRLLETANIDAILEGKYDMNEVVKGYLILDPDYKENHQLDAQLLSDICAILSKEKTTIARYYWLESKHNSPEELMTPVQLESFISYIGVNYGSEIVERHLMGEESLQITGKSLTALINEWKEHLEEVKENYYQAGGK